MPKEIYANYGKFGEWASRIDNHNNKLLDTLHEIQKLIKSLEGNYESDAAVIIRNKIQGMEPRFEDYYKVVGNYAIFLRNEYQAKYANEIPLVSNAEQFI